MNSFKFLFRTMTALSALIFTAHAAPIKDSDIVGTWHIITNLGYEEIVFTEDHTYAAVCVGITTGKQTGTWRIEKGELVKKWTGGTITFLRESKAADGSEKREELHALKRDTLTTQVPGQFYTYMRGPLPEDYLKPK